ncbi:MAG TPA: hypothetical protein DCZ94_17305 [Lentisphaeria bacterium]|nr:MAG: hypothetical protein A2X48_20875 [Lentisphaerae bacterium GWF2_49_21]HBC88703.1 hypothetical protein [Lentisphaeria bacterium]
MNNLRTAGISLSIALFLSISQSTSAADPAPSAALQIPTATPPESLPDASDLVPWPEKAYPEFAADSVVNTGSWLFDKPAGKHGVVQAGPDGKLYFADKTLARFWGTTTCYGMTFPEKPEEIEKMADSIAGCGYNIVRFHHNDMASNGLGYLQIKPSSNSLLDPKNMDRLDKLASELFKRGIYIYLDFADYRSFMAEDGIDDWEAMNKLDNKGWKGVFPHPKIVEAWKRAVTEFLKHKNPYTGRTWGEEPGVATVEIINENGQFWDWSFKTTDKIQKWHDAEWNRWLVAKYGTREKLDAAWTDAEGKKGLFDDEDPAKGNVFRPRLNTLLEWDRPYRSKTRGAARVNDYYAHLAESSISFYKEASKHIRSLGFKSVIVGSHDLHGAINQYAEVQGTGTIAAHLYAPGYTAWNARPSSKGVVVEGVDVKTTNWFSNIPRIKVKGVPGINGEWTGGSLTTCADVNLAVAAITSFQGVTQSLQFSFAHRWVGVQMPNFDNRHDYQAYRNVFAHTFSYVHNSPWMAVNRICASLFDRSDFSKPRYKANIAYSTEDMYEQNLHALGLSGGSGTIGNAALFLPLLHEVECVFFDKSYEGDADVVFMTGRSASGDYSKAKHAVIIGDNPYCDRYHKKRDIGVPAKAVNPNVKVVTLPSPVKFTVSAPWDTEKTLSYDKLEGAVELASIPANAMPIGKSEDGKYTLGWLDDRFLVIPNARAFQNQIGDFQWLYRLYVSACKKWKIDLGYNAAGAPFYRSDTKEMTVDWAFGTMIIDTPKTQGFSGFAGWRADNSTKNLRCKVDNPYANVLITSTDGKPVSESKRMLLVATGRNQNTGQELGKDKDGFTNYVKTGKGPILVEALRGYVGLSGVQPGLIVYALDCEGRRLGKVEVIEKAGAMSFNLSPKWGTIWFEISAADVAGPEAKSVAQWPLEEKPRTAAFPSPVLVPFKDFIEGANGKKKAVVAKSATDEKSTLFVAKDFASDKVCMFYGNMKMEIIPDAEKEQVLRAQFGKVTKDWHGGIWTNIAAPSNIKPEDCLGFGFTFKGDGTLPRDSFLYLKLQGGAAYKSKNLNKIFETDGWQDVLLTAADFTPDPDYVKKNPDAAKNLPQVPDWKNVNRIDFVCVGPLMDQQSVGLVGKFYFSLAKSAASEAQSGGDFKKNLPEPGSPKTPSIVIPFVADAAIKADGAIDEDVWKKSLGIAMDEDKVPEWHFFGSHVVDGKRLNDEGANFWLLATKAGLAIIAEVKNGKPEVVTEKADWYGGDCVEVFSDVENKGGKPTKQLFLAYKRANVDRAAASDNGIQIGRANLENGYLLEALIPWQALGFNDVPAGEFGIEFQLDFGRKGAGRVLQMTYGTGTNEAWIKSDKYIKAKIGK